jgi:hypothetical protein
MLNFPKGIRFVRGNEIPDSNSDKSEMLEKIHNANIQQGFVISNLVEDAKFKFYAEININAEQIWLIFRNLCEVLLPDEVMPIIGELDDEFLNNGEYDEKLKLLNLFEKFQFYLANDCYLQFGLGYESEAELTEVFVTPTKHFQVWTNDSENFRKVMKKHKIPEFEKLEFIDEFPRATKSLDYDNQFHNHEELINYLINQTGKFNELTEH